MFTEVEDIRAPHNITPQTQNSTRLHCVIETDCQMTFRRSHQPKNSMDSKWHRQNIYVMKHHGSVCQMPSLHGRSILAAKTPSVEESDRETLFSALASIECAINGMLTLDSSDNFVASGPRG